jgi:hypothetical protein
MLPSLGPSMSLFAELEVWQPTMMFLKEWPLDLFTDQCLALKRKIKIQVSNYTSLRA